MAAETAVFSTYELLESVILHLSPTEMTRVMRVSRDWRDLVQRSATIHQSRFLVPLDKSGLGDHRPNEQTHMPLYDSNTSITYSNSDTLQADILTRGPDDEPHEVYYVHLLEIGAHDGSLDPRLSDTRHEYATYPPCQALGLRLPIYHTSCIVYVKDGVRISDLEDTAIAMRATARRYVGGLLFTEVWVHFETVEVKETKELAGLQNLGHPHAAVNMSLLSF